MPVKRSVQNSFSQSTLALFRNKIKRRYLTLWRSVLNVSVLLN